MINLRSTQIKTIYPARGVFFGADYSDAFIQAVTPRT